MSTEVGRLLREIPEESSNSSNEENDGTVRKAEALAVEKQFKEDMRMLKYMLIQKEKRALEIRASLEFLGPFKAGMYRAGQSIWINRILKFGDRLTISAQSATKILWERLPFAKSAPSETVSVKKSHQRKAGGFLSNQHRSRKRSWAKSREIRHFNCEDDAATTERMYGEDTVEQSPEQEERSVSRSGEEELAPTPDEFDNEEVPLPKYVPLDEIAIRERRESEGYIPPPRIMRTSLSPAEGPFTVGEILKPLEVPQDPKRGRRVTIEEPDYPDSLLQPRVLMEPPDIDKQPEKTIIRHHNNRDQQTEATTSSVLSSSSSRN
ncbi:unnamed protein product [Cyprideis torosa]|uniref:Uncharacterized protein n=1 Tax=Cyprideis torosa TaxID=163714 RepID=A0A7R8W5D8_9CRUS|nr:unnamed protein product [Cyprideis torosa]CAG0881586.1 unnamed protein product [Cyprideis torosa]